MRFALALLFSSVTLVGCGAEIGDDCSSSAECGQGRFCDRASRGGYCTVTPCIRNSCPENSVCVEFENEETYCMRVCGSTGDCDRSGYVCDKESGPTGFCRQSE
jgi:hypothetical protein